MCSARFGALALPRSFLTLFQLSPAASRARRIELRPAVRPKVLSAHCRSFFSVQPWPGKPVADRLGGGDGLDELPGSIRAQKGGRPTGAAVGQGVGPVGVVVVDPLEHGAVLAAEPGGPGGGIVGAIDDQGEGQEAFAGAGVLGLEGQASQVLERLPPLLDLDADHRRPSPG